jgi:hypothetical protein
MIWLDVSFMDQVQSTGWLSNMDHTSLSWQFNRTAHPANVLLDVQWREVPRGCFSLVGLDNRGCALCYLNSVIQLLFHFPPFRELIGSVDVNGQPIVSALGALFSRMRHRHPGAAGHSTRDFTRALGWPESARLVAHDAVDFLHALMDYLVREIPSLSHELLRLFYVQHTASGRPSQSLVAILSSRFVNAATVAAALPPLPSGALPPVLFVQPMKTTALSRTGW